MNHSPLESVHAGLGAKLVDFGGWEMPLAYPSGTVAEHKACRTSVAVFDVSHLGTLEVVGSHALELLQACLTNDLGRIEPGRAQYTHLLDPATASVVDDIIVWWMEPDSFHVIPNASNCPEVLSVLVEHGTGLDVEVVDTTRSRAMLAIQGPTARPAVAAVAPDAARVGRFRIAPFDFGGVRCIAAGTGYTGEDGIECAVPVEAAGAFWTALVDAGAVPAGLGARDTLRLEAGFPLHGHELGGGITPLQAGLEWVVGWDKGEFLGREALAAQKTAGGYATLHGLATPGRRPPRQGQAVLLDGRRIGTITSGNFSPTLGHGIAMAMLEEPTAPGTSIQVDVRGTPMDATIVALPFYRAS